LQVAAANWLALATLFGPYTGGWPGVLIDIGSTTTDIIPLRDGQPIPQGRTDPERFRAKELVYTGVRRTPLCALLGREGAAELFATTLDVYLVLGYLPEDPDDHNTADGRPATRAAAHARLARMICADVEMSTEEQRERLADLVAVRQREMLRDALRQNLRRLDIADGPAAVILAGEGEFLAQRIIADPARFWIKEIVLSTKLGIAVSQAACAYAVAVLAAKE
jgi:probable H4MPT-linked C1 transfer pathway protein